MDGASTDGPRSPLPEGAVRESSAQAGRSYRRGANDGPARLPGLRMRLIAALERRLERLFERPAARLFPTPIHPLQLQRRLERALEVERLEGASRVHAPAGDSLHVPPVDLAALRRGGA